jgi:hypothetical protein
MDQSAVSILGRYNFRLFRPGENDATFTVAGGGVCVIACEHAGTDPGEIRFSLIWAHKSDEVLQTAKETLQQNWSQYCRGYLYALLASIDVQRERSQVVFDLRAHCKKESA